MNQRRIDCGKENGRERMKPDVREKVVRILLNLERIVATHGRIAVDVGQTTNIVNVLFFPLFSDGEYHARLHVKNVGEIGKEGWNATGDRIEMRIDEERRHNFEKNSEDANRKGDKELSPSKRNLPNPLREYARTDSRMKTSPLLQVVTCENENQLKELMFVEFSAVSPCVGIRNGSYHRSFCGMGSIMDRYQFS